MGARAARCRPAALPGVGGIVVAGARHGPRGEIRRADSPARKVARVRPILAPGAADQRLVLPWPLSAPLPPLGLAAGRRRRLAAGYGLRRDRWARLRPPAQRD